MKKIAVVMIVAFVASIAFSGCAAKGEKLWEKACNHMFDSMKAEAKEKGEKKEPTKEELDAAMKGCMEGFKAIKDEKVADEAANCILEKKDMKGFGECMENAQKKAAESKKEGGEKKEGEKKEEAAK